MMYALWGRDLGNQLGAFSTEEEALLAVRRLLTVGAPIRLEALLLEYEDEQGEGDVVAGGRALVERIARFETQRRLSA
jgi:hypothetical protein